MTAQEVIDALLEWIPPRALEQIAQALRDGRDMRYSVVKIIIEDKRVTSLRIEEMRNVRKC